MRLLGMSPLTHVGGALGGRSGLSRHRVAPRPLLFPSSLFPSLNEGRRDRNDRESLKLVIRLSDRRPGYLKNVAEIVNSPASTAALSPILARPILSPANRGTLSRRRTW